MANHPIGPSFVSEIVAAGLANLAVENNSPDGNFSWTDDGALFFGKDMTPEQIAAVQAVYDAHDPAAPAPVAVPETVTKYQACVVLARHSLLGQVNAFFDALATDDPRHLAWEMAATVQRHSESTLSAIAYLGLSEAQADGMFIEAAQVE
ncbi:hypothetical protein P3W66_07725 [Achromobacter denitrificans]|uniref:hypothetical protein n=1 Tax=Achromobacter denitrificans TaxID=32002 RepID=UPI001124DF02|nr:hypothetical protein [Achromobacter denitrificans]MDF3939916.1 hypothetical protein [Achromobacter denitrificans]